MKVAAIILFVVAVFLVGFGVYVAETGRSPDEAVGGVIPIVLGVIAWISALVLAIAYVVRG